jgi:ribosomal protein L21E|tara:strand:- start:455 stop:730 length:276 start_codon:yes stop_codon:yes gene_type:complete
MGKKKGGKSSGAVSKGERPNVSKWVRKDMRNSVAPIVTLQNKWKAFSEGKRVMVTIPNPSAKVETNKPFIRVTAQEAGWKKQDRFRMKQDG